MSRQVIWQGEVDGSVVRVLKASSLELFAEELVCRPEDAHTVPPEDGLSVDKDGLWAATEDNVAMHAYEAALLDAQHVLEQIKALEGTGAAYIPLGQWFKEKTQGT